MRPVPMRRAYDHRIRELVCTAGDVTLARRLGVPERTARSWLRRGRREVVSLDDGDDGGAGAPALRLAEAESRIALLELRLRRLRAVVHLLNTLVSVLGLRLDGQRLPEGPKKQAILSASRTASSPTSSRPAGGRGRRGSPPTARSSAATVTPSNLQA